VGYISIDVGPGRARFRFDHAGPKKYEVENTTPYAPHAGESFPDFSPNYNPVNNLHGFRPIFAIRPSAQAICKKGLRTKNFPQSKFVSGHGGKTVFENCRHLQRNA
jgi:hypothetical protein